jgi:basic amino acid/polyamine antiporter, APA family
MADHQLTPTEALQEDKSFKRSLGLLDATMIVAGSMIGSGIFIVSADMLKDLGSSGWLIAAWLITGFMTLTAALSYGELSSMFPKAGGQYVYLREAYNPFIGFLYGWSFFAVIQTGTIAAVAVAFGKFLGYLEPSLGDGNVVLTISEGFRITAAQLVGIVLVVLLTYINTKGIKGGKLIQTTFTSTKLLALFGLIIFGLLAAKSSVWNANWEDAWTLKQHMSRIEAGSTDNSWMNLTGLVALGAIASAMVGSIFSSDAWNNVTFIAGEVKNPQRNIGLSLFLGTLIVTIVYVAANLMYSVRGCQPDVPRRVAH